MSTIADYSVFTKAFLASNNVDFSKLYGTMQLPGEAEGFTAFAVIPIKLDTPLTPREAMNFDWSKFGKTDMRDRVSCSDANGNFIGNIVRIQPGVREGSIRLVAKVAVPTVSDKNVATSVNTFVLVRTDASTNEDLPIAVATISAGYTLHTHLITNGYVPLDDVENANYVSFTINNLNGYTSVDFNPDAYATYDDVENALSRGIDGLHIAFNSNTGDIILSDSKGNVIDQANLHLDLSADTIIAEGEEGYKYVKTDRNQDVHSAKAFMNPSPGKDDSYDSAFASSDPVPYNTKHASLVRFSVDDTPVCNGIRVRWAKQAQEGSEQAATQHDEIYWVGLAAWNNEAEGAPRNCLALNCSPLQNGQFDSSKTTCEVIRTASGAPIEVAGDSSIYSGDPTFGIDGSIYSHDVFVHTVGNSSLADWDECFQLMGFHNGDDIPLGTDLPALMQALTDRDRKLDPEEFIHGADADNAKKVADQRKLAKDEMVAYNSRRPAFHLNKRDGAIIDHTGLDVRNGRITLGCGRVGENGVFQKVNYGIQMKNLDPNRNLSESLDFTISHHTGAVDFENGHATGLTSSTLLSIEVGSYISGAPTCLILAQVTHNSNPNSEDGPTVFTPIRTTAGFSVSPSYKASDGLSLTIQDYRDNISAFLSQNGAPAIIEVQAIYTHPNAETVPAQQMHTYIGSWNYGEHPTCSFLCNKIEEWMTAVGLADTSPNPDTNPAENVKLYVVIRVY